LMLKANYITETLAGEFYENHHEQLDALETSIIKTIVANHERRKTNFLSLEQAQSLFDDKCEHLMAQLFRHGGGGGGEGKGDLFKVAGTKTNGNHEEPSTGKKRSAAVYEGGHDEVSLGSEKADAADNHESTNPDWNDPDWDEIKEFHPAAAANIDAFLEKRAKMRMIDDQFYQAVQDMNQKVSALVKEFKVNTRNAIKAIDQPLDEMQKDIQEIVMMNVERREQYEQLIEQRAKAAESLFSRLMSRTAGGIRRGFMKGLGLQKGDKQQKHMK
jgi:hypothetical protein